MGVRLYLILGVVAASLASRSMAITVINVSPTGDDAADGAKDHPLRTLHEAQRRARNAMKWDPSGVRVEISPGRYELPTPLVFTSRDSGNSAEVPTTYAASGGEVIISGGTPVSKWRTEEGLLVTDLPEEVSKPFRDLWVNGRRAVRARTPNDGYFRIESPGGDNRTSFVAGPADFQSLAAPAVAEIAFLHDWTMSRIRIASVDAGARLYSLSAPIGAALPQFAITGFESNPRYFIENARELVDAAGEWFYDPSANKLYYNPRAGESPDTCHAVVPRLEQLLVIRGALGKPVQHLAFEGITFAHTRFELPPAGYAGVQGSCHARRVTPDDDQHVTMTAAVRVDHAHHCNFLNCKFQQLAACGIHLSRCQESRIARSCFRDVGGDAILIGSRDKAEEPIAANISVVNCLIEHCGVNFLGAVGVWVGFAQDVTIAHNEIRRLPYTGVSAGWQWDDLLTPCRGISIRQNHIHHVMQQLSDGAGIYTLGRQPGTRIARNLIHDIPANSGRAESNGIFMDEGSTEISVERNTIYNVACSPVRFNHAGWNRFVGNRFAARPGVPTFASLATDVDAMAMESNEPISASDWRPPANDPTAREAGPGVELSFDRATAPSE